MLSRRLIHHFRMNVTKLIGGILLIIGTAIGGGMLARDLQGIKIRSGTGLAGSVTKDLSLCRDTSYGYL